MRTAARSLGTAIARDRLDDEREQRLSEQEARLAQLSAELRAFSYTVSHDLRAPVRQVGAFADMLRESKSDALGPDGLKKLDAIKDEPVPIARPVLACDDPEVYGSAF